MFPIKMQVRDRLPHLKAIVQYKGKLSQAYENVYDVSFSKPKTPRGLNKLGVLKHLWVL